MTTLAGVSPSGDGPEATEGNEVSANGEIGIELTGTKWLWIMDTYRPQTLPLE